MTPKFHSLKVKEIINETDDTVSISFEIPAEYRNDYQFSSGQYLTLKSIINGEDIRRSYSLSSAPYENEWKVAVKEVEQGKFSTYLNRDIKVGDELEVMTPMGNFKVNPNKELSRTIVLFAAGSGITPIISIAKTILKEEPNSEVILFYGNKNTQSIIYREEIEFLKNQYMDRLRVIHILSRENLGVDLQKGRIDGKKCDLLFKAFLTNLKIDGAYICGPEEMILEIKSSLINNGLEESKVHFELFNTSNSTKEKAAKSTANEPEVKAVITIIQDDDEFEINLSSKGESILDAALRGGADLPFACKGGVCCTCKGKVLEGTVTMDINYALEKDEVEAGYILTCQSHPTSERVVITFDE